MSAQQCTQCAAGSYSLGSGVRFDQWDSMPAGFSSLATSLESGPRGDGGLSCNRSASGMRGRAETGMLKNKKTKLFFLVGPAVPPGCLREAT